MTRRWLGGIGVVLALVTMTAAGRACQVCSGDMTCMPTAKGALLCLGDGQVCLMGGRCQGLGMLEEPLDAATLQVTLLEGGGGNGPAQVLPAPGGLAVGEAAQRVAALAPGAAAAGRVLFSLAGSSEGGIAVFRAPAGDGFTIARTSEGRGARLVVAALENGAPGRVLADARVGADDALVARVPFGGRTRTLVIGAATLPAAEAKAREPEVRRELARSHFGRPMEMRPPFELSVLDR